MTIEMIVERAKIAAEIAAHQTNLETLRTKEQELRDTLVSALESLVYAAGRAAHKIETRQYADGIIAIDWDWNGCKEAEEALTEMIDDIDHVELQIEDLQNTLDDDTISCPQCQMLAINGVACHETGCPNQNARWDGEEWVKQRKCFECGCTVDRDDPCCSEANQ